MGADDDTVTRRIVAGIVGVLGVVLLLDVLVIAVAVEHPNFDGFRQVLLLIVGSLLVLGGAVTFAWPNRGSVETRGDDPPPR